MRSRANRSRCASGTTRSAPTTWATWPRSGSATSWAAKLRLVRFDPEQRRLSSRTMDRRRARRPTSSADGFPLLVVSEGSLAELNRRLAARGQAPVGMERFRPNIVLDGPGGARRRPARRASRHSSRRGGAAAAGQALPALPHSRHRSGDAASAAHAGRRHACRPIAADARVEWRGDLRHERHRRCRAWTRPCACGQARRRGSTGASTEAEPAPAGASHTLSAFPIFWKARHEPEVRHRRACPTWASPPCSMR